MSQDDVLALIRLARKFPDESDTLLSVAERIGSNGAKSIEEPVAAVQAITFPLEVFCHYKWRRYAGMLSRDRSITVNGTRYSTPSAAAMSITKNNVNGWRWWWYQPPSGQIRQIDDLRRRGLI